MRVGQQRVARVLFGIGLAAAASRPVVSFEPPVAVKLTMVRDGKGLDAPRVYTLRIRPAAALGESSLHPHEFHGCGR